MITPLVALRKIAKRRHHPYRLPRLAKQTTLGEQESDTKTLETASPRRLATANTAISLPNMAYGGDLDVDEVMVDDGLVSDNDGVTFGLSEDEKEEVYIALQPKIPFAQRANPFVGPKDEKFQKIEDYFFYLLNSSELTVEDILEGTFDAHEISLITPQSEPSDIVQWQHRNARRYYENLETRFKGHPDTLAFKMACLYFGFPVEPLRTGTMSFDLPLDSDPTGTEGDATYVDPLAFLKKYEFEAECK